jgi:hypothetical protein
MIMTSKENYHDYGPPPPITKLTVEQDLKLRVLHDKLKENYHNTKDDVINLMVALQHQNFVLANSLTNLVEKWPKVQPITKEALPMFGILLENKN